MLASTQQLLQDIKATDLAGNVPSVSATVGQWLHEVIKKSQATSILEVGTAHAYSTIWMASATNPLDGHIHTIDLSLPSVPTATQNIKQAKFDHCITQHFGNALEVIPTIHETFDFIFIDARKRDTHLFFELCSPKLTKNGLIVIDDVEKFKIKMQPFWKFITTQTAWRYETLPLDADDSIMVMSRK